jgi:hypothetical protein
MNYSKTVIDAWAVLELFNKFATFEWVGFQNSWVFTGIPVMFPETGNTF